MRYCLALCLALFACGEEAAPAKGEAPSTKKRPKFEKLMKMNPPPKKLTKPEPVLLDVPAADVVEWQVKTNPEAAARVEACQGYQALAAKQTEEKKLSTRLHKAIDLTTPYWIFAIEEKEKEQTTLLNYCTLNATSLDISCSPAGTTICP